MMEDDEFIPCVVVALINKYISELDLVLPKVPDNIWIREATQSTDKLIDEMQLLLC